LGRTGEWLDWIGLDPGPGLGGPVGWDLRNLDYGKGYGSRGGPVGWMGLDPVPSGGGPCGRDFGVGCVEGWGWGRTVVWLD